MTNQQKIVCELINKHAQKARESEYDRTVAISAISASREVIRAVPSDQNREEYAASLLSEIQKLLAGYHDPDGEYTSGKGVIGALLDDLQFALRRSSKRGGSEASVFLPSGAFELRCKLTSPWLGFKVHPADGAVTLILGIEVV